MPALHKDGRQISIEFAILLLRGEAGTLLGLAAFLRDATARFEEQRALRRERVVEAESLTLQASRSRGGASSKRFAMTLMTPASPAPLKSGWR
jgi:hypothetical protein